MSATTDAGRSFSALDAFWILLGAAVLILLLVGLLPFGGSAATEREVRYVVRVRDVDPSVLGTHPEVLIPAGASVRNENGTAVLGSVESVCVREQMRATVRDGQIVSVEDPAYRILEVTVWGSGSVKEGDGVRIGDVRIAAGSVGSFRLGGYYAAHASVVSVVLEEVEE